MGSYRVHRNVYGSTESGMIPQNQDESTESGMIP